MQYRRFGHLDINVSALGFGCMRLPVMEGKDAGIDEAEAIRIIRYGIDNGINYIDTAYPYHKGQSELVVGKALKDGYRDKVYLATKSPVWLVNTHEDFDKYLNEQLTKLQTDHIDMYLLHALSKDRWEKLKELGVFEFLERAVKSGKIRYAGFSFHDDLPVFKEIVDSYSWDFCQIQYNFMDTNYQAGTEGLKYAADKGLAVVIMEPLKGGKLAKNPPKSVEELWNTSDAKRTPAEWALSWIWNQKEVSLVLSGMGSMDMVVENVRSADNAIADSLSVEDLNLIDKVKARYNELIKVNCTGCAYCMPCPFGVDIPSNFSLLNQASMYDDFEGHSFSYNNHMSEKSRASSCAECGKCETLCPQNLPIRRHLKEVHQALKK